MPSSDGGIVVQQSFPDPRPTTNPYLVMLAESLRATEGVTPRTFEWRRALRADYDVFHVHWPENLTKGHSAVKSLGRRVLTRLLLHRLRTRGIPIVRTMHNLERPQGRSKAELRLLDRIDRQTSLVIRLNEQTPVSLPVPVTTILHGHYRDWFERYPRAGRIPGRLGYFGLIRRYKNVRHLVEVHRELPSEFTLRIAGSPSTPDLAAEIAKARGDDPRVQLDFHFLSDAELVQVVTESDLVVLPYTEMHNSGSVLAALSLDRPVLVQGNPVNEALSAEVGPGWVHLYAGELEPADVEGVHARIADAPAAGPDLGRRNWDDAGAQHLAAYRRAIEGAAVRSR